MRKITIEWSYPMEIESILYDKRMSDIGIYYILQEDLETTYLICISERLYIALGADWRVITGTGLINTGERSM